MDMVAWWSSYVGITEKAIEIDDRIFPKNDRLVYLYCMPIP